MNQFYLASNGVSLHWKYFYNGKNITIGPVVVLVYMHTISIVINLIANKNSIRLLPKCRTCIKYGR